MFDFNLSGNRAYQWIEKNNCYFTGYFIDNDNNFFDGEMALDYILRHGNEYLYEHCRNGLYTFIKAEEKKINIITDNINYFPVFFIFLHGKWIIGDDWNKLLVIKGNIEPNYKVETEFLSIGFVLDNETLDERIFKTRAGEKVVLNDDGSVERIPGFYFLPDNPIIDTFDDLRESAFSLIEEAGHRLIKFLNGRTAVVPLSGGFDSRIIVSVLKKLKYENVICFTYGKINPEVEISRRVAEILDYEWHFIDYTEINLDTYIEEEDFLEYMKFTGNGFSMPFLQEYFAVKELKEKNIISSESVFLPGHVGDNTGGSYVHKSIKTSKQNDELADNLIETYFYFEKIAGSKKRSLKNRLNVTLQNYPVNNIYSETYNPYIEDWSVKEKFSKFLFHSSKVFDFRGYQTYFLLWDRSITDFFRNIPYEYREYKFLYDDVAINKLFIPLGIYFQERPMKFNKDKVSIQKLKNELRSFFPWKYILNRMIERDWMYYYQLTSVMNADLQIRGNKPLVNYKAFNAIICRWYLHLIDYYKK